MKNGEIFKKTMPFVWRRLGMYLLLNVGIILYYALVLFIIAMLAKNESAIGIIIFLIACPIGISIYTFGCRYISYMIKAAHVAAIGQLAVTGSIPEGQSVVAFGKSKVKERFIATNAFFALDKLVTGAVKQIQNMITRVGNIFGNIEFIQNIIKILNLFVEIVLGYVDEAVLARVFYKKEENAWKASADGVVLYFQNWKEILKNAAMLVIFIILFYAIGMGICYAIFMGLALFSDLWTILAIIIAFFLIDVIKQSFVDSYITISVVNKYMTITVNQVPQVDLYEKARGWSKKFQELCGKATAEGAQVGVPTAAVAGMPGVVAPVPYEQGTVPVQQPIPTPIPPQQPIASTPVAPAQPVPQAPIQQVPTQPVVAPQSVPVQQPVMHTQPVPQAPIQPVPAGSVQPIQQPAPMQQPAQPQPIPTQPVAQTQIEPVVAPVMEQNSNNQTQQ